MNELHSAIYAAIIGPFAAAVVLATEQHCTAS